MNDREQIKLGVIEFHTGRNAELVRQFYQVTNDLKAAGCIVDLWLMDIATVLKRHGYSMEVYREAVGSVSPVGSVEETAK